MRIKNFFGLLIVAITSLYFTACHIPSSKTSINKTDSIVYKNSVLGISIAFPLGWQVITHAQYQPKIIQLTDPQVKSLFEAVCSKALFCAVNISPTHEETIAAMGAKQAVEKPWDEFYADIQKAIEEMKKYGKNNLRVVSVQSIQINQQKFIHVIYTQDINTKRYMFDTYYTQYPTFSLDYIAISTSPHLIAMNAHIMQNFNNI